MSYIGDWELGIGIGKVSESLLIKERSYGWNVQAEIYDGHWVDWARENNNHIHSSRISRVNPLIYLGSWVGVGEDDDIQQLVLLELS